MFKRQTSGSLNNDTVKMFVENKKLKRKNMTLQTKVDDLTSEVTKYKDHVSSL
jgi:uncharacterized protein YlxW (UPF0749 family)